MDAAETIPYLLEKVSLDADSDDDFDYKEVPLQDYAHHNRLLEEEETLQTAVKTVKEAKLLKTQVTPNVVPENKSHPEAVEDYVRNFLMRNQMQRTFDCFQVEWFERVHQGLVKETDYAAVPDVYLMNEQLQSKIEELKSLLHQKESIIVTHAHAIDKMKRERDYHRLSHRRILQEKANAEKDMKRAIEQRNLIEKAYSEEKSKHEVAFRGRALAEIECSKIKAEVNGLKQTLSQSTRPIDNVQENDSLKNTKKGGASHGTLKSLNATTHHPLDSDISSDANAQPPSLISPSMTANQVANMALHKTTKAHEGGVSHISLHPRKKICCTTSDDHSFKVWNIADGEVLWEGRGHTDWVAGSEFHPHHGGLLATCSGDATVRFWDLPSNTCVSTFAEHSHPVWSLSFHHTGDFLASSSMDSTVKVWDVNSQRCRRTFRGHSDSVNSVSFQGFSNLLLSASADKTMMLWDLRTGLSVQTLAGVHASSINRAVFTSQGNRIVSGDSSGSVVSWELRTMRAFESLKAASCSVNHVSMDASDSFLSLSMDDGLVQVYDAKTFAPLSQRSGHTGAVNCSVFDPCGEGLYSVSSDTTLRFWKAPA